MDLYDLEWKSKSASHEKDTEIRESKTAKPTFSYHFSN